MSLHPATQILIWCVLVAAMQFLSPANLVVAGGLVLLSAFVLSRHKFVQLLRRTRWILFSLWLIYAYSTPGQPISEVLGSFSPSLEGLHDGGLQLMRLLAALAGLAILLDRLHRQQLIAGLYSLFIPLEWLGLSRERLAVRLALTLHYAEVAMLRTQSWQDSLRSLTMENRIHETENRNLVLPVYRFRLIDVLMVTGAVFLLWQVMR
ncbi:MAG: CbiQ family ECF transporter T component [Gallionella sp.]|jgi:energy-coupling factor transport system permease protein